MYMYNKRGVYVALSCFSDKGARPPTPLYMNTLYLKHQLIGFVGRAPTLRILNNGGGSVAFV